MIRQQFAQRGFAIVDRFGEDHFAHRVDAISLEEHVLSAAKTNAASAEGNRVARLLRIVGIRANLELGGLRAPFHQLSEALVGWALLRIE